MYFHTPYSDYLSLLTVNILDNSPHFPPLIPSLPFSSGSLYRSPERTDKCPTNTPLRGYWVHYQSSYMPWGLLTFPQVSSQEGRKGSDSVLHSWYTPSAGTNQTVMEGGLLLPRAQLSQETVLMQGFAEARQLGPGWLHHDQPWRKQSGLAAQEACPETKTYFPSEEYKWVMPGREGMRRQTWQQHFTHLMEGNFFNQRKADLLA